VTRGDAVGSVPERGSLERRVPLHPCGVLDGPPLDTGPGAYVHAAQIERIAHSLGQISARVRIAVRCVPELVVDVGHRGNRASGSRNQLAQEQQERRGIGSAGQRDQDTRPRRAEAMPLDRPPDART